MRSQHCWDDTQSYLLVKTSQISNTYFTNCSCLFYVLSFLLTSLANTKQVLLICDVLTSPPNPKLTDIQSFIELKNAENIAQCASFEKLIVLKTIYHVRFYLTQILRQ